MAWMIMSSFQCIAHEQLRTESKYGKNQQLVTDLVTDQPNEVVNLAI